MVPCPIRDGRGDRVWVHVFLQLMFNKFEGRVGEISVDCGRLFECVAGRSVADSALTHSKRQAVEGNCFGRHRYEGLIQPNSWRFLSLFSAMWRAVPSLLEE